MAELAQLVSITTSTGDSGWFDISQTTKDVAVTVAGTFSGTFVFDVSDDPTKGTKDYATLTGAYTTPQILGVPRAFHYFRVRATALASGAIQVGVSNGINALGHPYAIVPEGQTFG